MKWEDKLVRYPIHVIIDHKALEFFKMQSNLTGHQMWWMDYLSRFNFDIMYIKGEKNKVADCLSHYYKNDNVNDIHIMQEYVRANVRIDPVDEDLPPDQFVEVMGGVVELCAMQEEEHQGSHQLQEKLKLWDVKAQELTANVAIAPMAGTPSASTVHLDRIGIMIEDMLCTGPSLDQLLTEDNDFMANI